MRWIKNLFYIAGIYGLIALLPQYFLERRIGIDNPPPITHPEYFYAFLGVAVAWQAAFLIIGSDPLRFRPIIPAAIIEKYSFFIAAVVLFAANRITTLTLFFACIDAVLGTLFTLAWMRLGKLEQPSSKLEHA